MNDGGDCGTAPVTPGLLNNVIQIEGNSLFKRKYIIKPKIFQNKPAAHAAGAEHVVLKYSNKTTSYLKKENILQPQGEHTPLEAIPRPDMVTQRPCGLMDKASVSDTGDCKFESCQGRQGFWLKFKRQKR